MSTVPTLIPASTPVTAGGNDLPTSSEFSLYDVALNGIGFTYANTPTNPLIRETADYTKERIDQAATPGEQTLSNWWIKSQDSFHGGAGQLNLEPPVDSPIAHVRYLLSKNVDPFTPGLLTRLPDTSVVSSTDIVQVIGLAVSGADAAAVLLSDGSVQILSDLDSASPTVTALSGVSSVLSIATDGARVYCATATAVQAVDPAVPGTATTVASYPAAATSGPVLGWAKARLMLGVSGAVYQLDVSQTGVTLGAAELLLQHPTPGWTWRAFCDSPTAILAAGDAGVFSEIDQFVLNSVAGAPVLQPGGTVCSLPVGERVLSLCGALGTYVAVGTTRGVRIGEFDAYYGRLHVGPLTLSPIDPTIPGNAVTTRDRFVYVAGRDYDEAGLLTVDLGTTVDDAGRFAWAPGLICPTVQTSTDAVDVAVLPVSGRLVFAVATVGLLLEGSTTTGREAWLTTSRVRFGTTEPKLFKLGTVRADLTSSDVKVVGVTPTLTAPLAEVGFTTTIPPDFRLPSGLTEWLQLQFLLSGDDVQFRSYQVKALPGTRRQVRIKLVLSIDDSETTRSGQRIRDKLSARNRRDALEQLAAGGDEVLLQEFTPSGVQSTVVVVEQVQFNQVGRPTKTSDVGGEATVILRTVDL